MNRRSRLWMLGLLAMSASCLGTAALAEPLTPSEQRGFTYINNHCSRCHSIDKVSPSPFKPAPPFRTLHNNYPIENLQEAMAEGLTTGHPAMPEFRLDPDQIRDAIAYLKTLER